MPKKTKKNKVAAKPKGLPKPVGAPFPEAGASGGFLGAVRSERELEQKSHGNILEKGALYACGLFTLFTMVILWGPLTHPDFVPGSIDMNFEYPYKIVWIQSVLKGEPAFWNPYSGLGQPFLAMSTPGAYAPFNFLFFIFPISYAFTLGYLFHFIIGALGVYFFIRSLGSEWLGACLGAMAFTYSGFFMGHFYWGHPNMIWAVCWIPPFLYCLKRYTDLRSLPALFFSAVFMGCSILEAMPQINMYALMFGGFLLAWACLVGKINWKEVLGAQIFLIVVSFSIGLCQLVPAYEFAHLSNRWFWEWGDIMKDVFLPQYFRFFIQPFFLGSPWDGTYHGEWGYQEVVIYIGLIPLFLALAGFFGLFRKRPFVWWLFFVALLSTALAMADSTALTHQIYLFFYKYLPGFGHNRSVSRIMVFTAFALSCLAGMALDAWIKFWRSRNLSPFLQRLLILWIPVLLLGGTVVDLYRYDRMNTVPHYDYHEFYAPWMMMDPEVIKRGQTDPDFPRVQPESMGDYELLHKVSAVMTGYPVLIQTTTMFLDQQWDFPDSPLTDIIHLMYRFKRPNAVVNERWQPIPGIQSYLTDTKALPRAFMVGGYSVNTEPIGLFHISAIDDLRTGKVDPRQEVILTKEPEGKPDWPKGWVGEAKITRYDYDDVDLDCTNDRPCFLFLSDSYYPGWKATVDGKEETIYQADAAFRVVELKNPGHHTVKMSYYPGIIVYSFFYSLATWILLLACWLSRKKLGEWARGPLGKLWPFSMPIQADVVEMGKRVIGPRRRSKHGGKLKS